MLRWLHGNKDTAIPHVDTNLVQYQPGIKVMADSVLTWAFDQPTTTPVILSRGPGRVAGQLDVYQAGPQLFSPLSIPTNSFGGTQAGKFILSPLVDTTGDSSVG